MGAAVDQAPSRWLIIVVVPLVVAPLLLSIASVLLSPAFFAWGWPPNSGPNPAWFALVGGVIGVLFWGSILRKLLRAIRGVEAEHLMPHWLVVTFALFFGVSGIAILAAMLAGALPWADAYGAGACLGLLAYPIREIRRSVR
ncbi:MAG TPA: hypothetical protein VF765_33395 [Polyangiaceae bacterium]